MKTFRPKPLCSGARIEWAHRLDNGTVVQRTGVVWDRAPAAGRYTIVVWVTPDVAFPGDLYTALAVGKRFEGTAEWVDGKRVKIEVFESSDSIHCPMGSMTVAAWRGADRVQRAAASQARASQRRIKTRTQSDDRTTV